MPLTAFGIPSKIIPEFYRQGHADSNNTYFKETMVANHCPRH